MWPVPYTTQANCQCIRLLKTCTPENGAVTLLLLYYSSVKIFPNVSETACLSLDLTVTVKEQGKFKTKDLPRTTAREGLNWCSFLWMVGVVEGEGRRPVPSGISSGEPFPSTRQWQGMSMIEWAWNIWLFFWHLFDGKANTKGGLGDGEYLSP